MPKNICESRVALVTGAAGGIGRAIAEELASAGFNIGIADISGEDRAFDVLENCREKGSEVFYVQADISSPADRTKILSETDSRFGRIDVLVNNAGVAPRVRADILEATEESFDRVMGINLKGPYFLTQQIALRMIEQKKSDNERMPVIINIGSVSAYTSSPGRGEYCISKAGVGMMTKLYADRLANFGVMVYEIRPGIIKTRMTAGVREKYDRLIAHGITPLKRWGLPVDIARAARSLAENNFPFSTGEVINVDGGFHLRRL